MDLCISNIAWEADQNEEVYSLMQKYWFTGLEIAPKKVWKNFPLVNEKESVLFLQALKKYGISPAAMQGLHFWTQDLFLFKTEDERHNLLEYTKSCLGHWAKIWIKSFIFWSPKNRIIPDHMNEQDSHIIAQDFFNNLWDYAQSLWVYVCIEPNPEIYGWNFLLTTQEALKFVVELSHPHIKLHADLGTMIENNEDLSSIETVISYISHFHISEPYLELIQKRENHAALFQSLKHFNGYISVEMKATSTENIENVLKYVSSHKNQLRVS